MAFTCANVIAVRVKEELVAPACCSGVGLGVEGNEDWDTFTKGGAEEGLPKGKVPTCRRGAEGLFCQENPGGPSVACEAVRFPPQVPMRAFPRARLNCHRWRRFSAGSEARAVPCGGSC